MQQSYIIIYLDLAGFSKNNEQLQVEHHLVYDEIIENTCILIPTGDGIIIGIENKDLSKYIRAFDIIIGISDWANRNECKLRSSIHTGEANIIRDINRNNNIIGHTINDASRMLGGAVEGAIILSKKFYEKFIGKSLIHIGDVINVRNDLTLTIADEDTIIDKHSFGHLVYNIIINNKKIEYGDKSKILKKENLTKSFQKRVKASNNLIFYGIYNPSVPNILQNIEMNQHKNIEIFVYYAAEKLDNEIFSFFGSNTDNLNPANRSISQKGIMEWYEKNEFKKNIKLSIFEYEKFITFGGSFVDIYTREKGFIHISNYINGIIPAETPYIELEWKTINKPPLYEFYFNYFNENIFRKGKMIFNF